MFLCSEPNTDVFLHQASRQYHVRNESFQARWAETTDCSLLYLHVCVDLVHRLWLMITEQTHSRHWVSLPVRPITVDQTEKSDSRRREATQTFHTWDTTELTSVRNSQPALHWESVKSEVSASGWCFLTFLLPAGDTHSSSSSTSSRSSSLCTSSHVFPSSWQQRQTWRQKPPDAPHNIYLLLNLSLC